MIIIIIYRKVAKAVIVGEHIVNGRHNIKKNYKKNIN